jgi:hypothetical protein
VWMCSQYRNGLAPALDRNPTYECQSWTKDQLGRAKTIIRMAPNRNSSIPFLSFTHARALTKNQTRVCKQIAYCSKRRLCRLSLLSY